MQKMKNALQYYDWGCPNTLSNMYSIKNDDNKPIAEIWMGAHPKAPSTLIYNDGSSKKLDDAIQENPSSMLGPNSYFKQLPFLLKVLCAKKPLSIQVHPSKMSAIKGFKRENELKIPFDASNRNYKDDNHKPEMIYAITDFKGMCGFKRLEEISVLMTKVQNAHPYISKFIANPSWQEFKCLFECILKMDASQANKSINILMEVAKNFDNDPWNLVKELHDFYPNDNCLFSPLFLESFHLKPGQVIFLPSQTPHAYIKGVAIEIMANSDNVLRAGLTSKYIDVKELIENIDFKEYHPTLVGITKTEEGLLFIPPVEEFNLAVYKVDTKRNINLTRKSPTIVFCLEGKLFIKDTINLNKGESCFINYEDFPVNIHGDGHIAIASTNRKDC